MMDQQNEVKKPVLLLKYDYVARKVFSDPNDQDIVIDFISSVIEIPASEFASIQVADPALIRDFPEDKTVILDVRVITKSGHSVDIEIQRAPHIGFIDRTIFNNAKNLTKQLARGDQYCKINRSISIIIVDFPLFDDDRYTHRFMYYDEAMQIKLSDITELNYLELKKLPQESDGSELYGWLGLFNAQTEEEMDAIAKDNPIYKKAVMKVIEMSQDEKERRYAEAEEKQRFREVNLYYTGQLEGRTEGRAEGQAETTVALARKMKAKGYAIADIAELSGLSADEIEKL
ncbi:MAG: Rpn family recombination-promoting nuclease/putative transposase [Clostridiales Family XIII bacterium]|nr:Rpn family recombination-promoting nuclease/putative transposase [Clostridiales Family XIII bacterium]